LKRLLLIRTDSLGDNILFSSVLPHIREKFKEWEITFACKERVKPLYDLCPFIDEVIDINSHCRKDYDLAINSVYSRTLLSDSLTFEAGAKETIAFRGDNQNILPGKISEWENNNKKYSKLIEIPLDHNSCEIDKYYYLLKELGIIVKDLKPQVWIEHGSYSDGGHIVIFCGGGWPPKYVFNLGRALNDFIDDDTEIIALGGFYEWLVNQANLESIKGGNKVNLCGETSLLQAMQIINNSKLVVGVDTGLGHAACALDKDNIILAGGGHPGRFFPYHPRTILVRKEMDCYGCNWRCTIEKKIDCMNIPDETIKEKISLKLKTAKKRT
jgi:ADP-heptose:LPS heptosyltransferase